MKKVFIFFLLLTAGKGTASAQSILKDKSGEATILTGNSGIAVNSGDASISGDWYHSHTSRGVKRFTDLSLKFGATEGAASLFNGTKFKPEIEANAYLGRTLTNQRKIYWGGKLSSTFFKLLKTDQSNTFDDRAFVSPAVFVGFNKTGDVDFFDKKGVRSSFIFGITATVALISNLADLTAVDVYQTTSITKNDTTRTLMQDKNSGYSGDYHRSVAGQINADFYVYPKFMGGIIGVGGYARTQLFGYQPRQNLGIGALVGKDGAPTNIVVGLLYQFNDVFNQLGKENQFFKRGGVNIVAGYKF